MTRYVIFCCLLLLLTKGAVSQDFKSLYRRADHYFNLDNPTAKTDSLAVTLFLQASELALRVGDFITAIESTIKAGSIHQTDGHYNEAVSLYRKAIDVNRQFSNDTALFYQAFLYLGSTFYSSGSTDSAAVYFEKASELSMFHPQSADFPDQEGLYNSLGTIYFESANYQQAKNYFEKALKLTGLSPGKPDETIVTLQSNIANCFLQLRQHHQAIEIFRRLLGSGLHSRVLTHNIAHTHFEAGQYDSSMYYFGLVERQNDIVTVRMQNDLGRIYISQGKWKLASETLDSALKVSNQIFRAVKNRDRALNYFIRSMIADKEKDPDESLKWCNKGISEVHFRFVPKNIYDIPSNEIETVSPITFLELLQQKARLLELRYRKTHNSKDLDACLRTHLLAIHSAAYIKRCFDNDEAKLYFQQDQRAVYHNALRIVHELMGREKENYIDALMEITEAYKGSIVYENIRHLDLSAKVQLPTWVIEKERSLKQSLAFYTTRLNNNISPQVADDFREKLVATNVELSRILALYDRDPAYQLFRNQRPQGLNSFKKIADKLDDETAIISYITAPDYVYVLAITSEGFKTHAVRRDSILDSIFKSFIKETYGQVEGRRYTGYSPGNYLYERLVLPLLDIAGVKLKWVILPDGFLSYLPFEALCVSHEDRDYLLFHRQISYHYSFSLLFLSNGDSGHAAHNQKLFFAPFSRETPAVTAAGLPALVLSQTEVVDTSATTIISSEATKTKWLSSLNGPTILHLATHATTGNGVDTNALIYFYPSDSLSVNNNLYVDEIYQLNLLHTNLIVLSACETAGGQSTSGEGLLSLSRAFLYAGTKGVVSSLWKTEDFVSAFLMREMYAEIAKGLSTEQALREAKLTFLRNDSINARYKTPNYWSNFVFAGKLYHTRKTSNINWWLTGVAILILTVIFIFKKSYPAKTE